jgi:hypothetical protein
MDAEQRDHDETVAALRRLAGVTGDGLERVAPPRVTTGVLRELSGVRQKVPSSAAFPADDLRALRTRVRGLARLVARQDQQPTNELEERLILLCEAITTRRKLPPSRGSVAASARKRTA